ncbi:NAD(P)/FAD-dependent oxidoreductase [Frigidibacter sp. MR17.24]|uniref:NAD(P)/FAD-dependent oxidoreductase n=1 Tax=Frigidibacter sp. MR17.24 TaxID=3127345 RepID=UPI003012AF49
MRDFLIIGGGIAGIVAAARLSELGSVVLIEAETSTGYHASGRSAALFEPNYGLPPVVALSRATGPALAEAGVLSPRGMLLLGARETAQDFAADVVGMELDEIGVDEAVARVPVLDPAGFDRAALGAHAFDIDTDLWMQGLLKAARGRGAEVLTGRRVGAIARVPGGWQATTPAGTVEGRQIVNAAGAWADAIAAMAGIGPLGLVPHRRSVARIAAPGGHDLSGWPMIFGAGESWYAKPDAGALIVSPAEEEPMAAQDAWPEDMVLAEGLARWQAVSRVEVTRPVAAWAGLRTFAPDRVLVIGPDPRAADFLWMAGQGGYGFQTSAGAGQLLADLVAGRAPALEAATVAALSPSRLT